MEPPFEVVGAVPAEWAQDLGAFAEALADHPWGGRGLERLVVGNVEASLREWLPQVEYERWRATQGVRSVVTGGKSFVAHDARRTAVVPALGDRLIFLHLPGHEMVEAALDARQDAEGYEFVDSTHWGASHVLWTEYVVERTRRRIAAGLGWSRSALDNGFVVQQLQELQNELPALVQWAVAHGADPMESHQHWFELVRVYAMSRGRADADSPADEREFTGFFAETLGFDMETQWHDLDSAFRAAYERPSASTQELDELVHDGGWRPLYEAYRSVWTDLLEAKKG